MKVPFHHRERSGESKQVTITTRNQHQLQHPNILLQTAKIVIIGGNGKQKTVNVLFDKGSQRSFVTKSLCKELNIGKLACDKLCVNTFGTSKYITQECWKTCIETKTQRGLSFILPALAVNTICDQITQSCVPKNNVNLKDLDIKNAQIDGKIEVLIGLDSYWDVVTGEIINNHTGLVAMNSIYGWLVSGKEYSDTCSKGVKTFMCCCKPITDLCASINPTCTDCHSQEDDSTYKTFEETLKLTDGRHSVRLPWRFCFNLSVNYYQVALTRLHLLTK